MEEEIAVKIHTKAVHAGDRKKPGPAIPTTTPICTATAFTYDKMEELDRIFGREVPGYSYSRYDSPTSAALEELTTALESGHGSLTCASCRHIGRPDSRACMSSRLDLQVDRCLNGQAAADVFTLDMWPLGW